MLVGMWSNTNPHSLLVEMQIGTAALEDSLMVSYKTKHTLIIGSSNHIAWCLPKESENIWSTQKPATPMFIAAFFIITRTWRPPRWPSEGEWINKLWYIQMIEYYSVLKRAELSSHEKTGTNLKCILLSVRSHSEKATYYMISTVFHSGKGKTVETVKRSVVASG